MPTILPDCIKKFESIGEKINKFIRLLILYNLEKKKRFN